MQPIIHKITVDISGKPKYKQKVLPLNLVRDDNLLNIFEISVKDDGTDVALSDITRATVTFLKDDGNPVIGDAVVDNVNNVLTYTFQGNELSFPGNILFTVELYKNGGRQTSGQIKFKVVADLDNGSGIPSTPEYAVLTQLINDTQASKDAAYEAATSANSASQSAHEAASSVQGAIDGANNAAGTANTAATNANDAATNANNAATAANTAAQNANNAADTANTSAANATQTAETAAQQANDDVQNFISKIVHKGAYSPDVLYEKNNEVLYQGSTYRNTVSCKGILPTNTANWQLVAQKGIDGLGSGDMTKAIYDTDNDGVVDNASALQGHDASYFETPSGAQAKIDALAGEGNTATVKAVADALTTHKADSAYYVTDYGADKTGMTNSAPAIQNAINAANTAGGGVVYFPKGTYIIASTLTVYANIKLVGAGINKSIIKRPSGSNFNMIVMMGDYGEIVDLTIDGNASENADIKKSEIILNGQFCIVRNCMIANSSYIGIEVSADNCKVINCISTGSNSPTIPSIGVWSDYEPNKQNLLIDGCVFKNHGINAILAVVDGLQIINCIFINNHLQTSPTGGGQIFLKQSANGNYVISDNIFKDGGGTATSGIECEASNVVISNNIIERHKFHGIALSKGSNYVIQGNIIRNNGNISSGAGIRIDSEVNDFIIANNYIYDNQTVKTQKYGISISEGNSDNFIISNNFFDGNITNHISDSSAGFNKKIENNIPSNVNYTYQTFTLTNEEIKQLTPGSVPALIEIYNISSKAVAKFMARGSDNAVVKIFDPLNVFDITDTGTNTAIYHDGTNYVMKNKGASTRYYSVKITLL